MGKFVSQMGKESCKNLADKSNSILPWWHLAADYRGRWRGMVGVMVMVCCVAC